MIKAVIIDDEPELRELNRSLLLNNFEEIELVGMAGSVEEGAQLIDQLQPQLILLDIRLTDGTGFQILQKIQSYKYTVIFITAYSEFAIKAIKLSAIDYILKPINEKEFCSAVERAIENINSTKIQDQVETFFNYYERKNQNRRIVLKTTESINIIEISDIVYCRSDNTYTTFYLNDREKILISRPMKEYEEMLSEYGFFRPHQSFLVNMQYVSRLDKTDGGFLILKDHTEIPVSIRRKSRLIQVLENL
ncbi:MAG TPA: LytTR family DNA-binding domain-containing protein [Prolixibacteraceae bacterium]|nr:LytTR family DNA-binding domain-containing protein [Prolixibacteraceae bacterium]